MKIPHYFILENDEHHVSLLLHILETTGEFTYQVFSHTTALLIALKEKTPSLILCKVSITGCDAREICTNPSISAPMIFLSDLYEDEERRSCFLDSHHPYISAPFYPEKIIPLLQAKIEYSPRFSA